MKSSFALISKISLLVAYAILAVAAYYFKNETAVIICDLTKKIFVLLLLKEIFYSSNTLFRKLFFLSAAIFTMGLLFKILHWPYATELILISLLSVCVFIIPYYLKINEPLMLRILKPAFLFTITLFTLMRILHWPGLLPMMLLNELTIVVGLLALIVFPSFTNENNEQGLLK